MGSHEGCTSVLGIVTSAGILASAGTVASAETLWAQPPPPPPEAPEDGQLGMKLNLSRKLKLPKVLIA